MDRLHPAARVDGDVEFETRQRLGDSVDDRAVGIADSENPLAVASLGVENPSEETLRPVRARVRWPFDDLFDASYTEPSRVANRGQRFSFADGGLERSTPRFDFECLQEMFSALQGLEIHHRQSEMMKSPRPTPRVVCVRREVSVAADDPAQVTRSVVEGLLRRLCVPASPQEMVVRCEVRPSLSSVCALGHMFPTALREKAVVCARDQPRSVLEFHAISRVDASPVVEYFRLHIPAVLSDYDRSVDFISDP